MRVVGKAAAHSAGGGKGRVGGQIGELFAFDDVANQAAR